MPHMAATIIQIGASGLLWAAAFRGALLLTPGPWIPRCLDTRIRRTRSAAAWVGAASVALLLVGLLLRLTS